MQKIYLDHSATTPIDPEVRKKIHPYMTEIFGNASSLHSFGQDAIKGVDWAREQLATLFGSKFKEVIFTSGATESNNLALRGLLMAFRYAKKENWDKKFHIITSKIEHPAILEVCQSLVKEGLAEVTYVNVDKKGIVIVDEIKTAIKDNTILISIMYVNNEIGTIQPIRKIGEMIGKENLKRSPKSEVRSPNSIFNKIYFHTDAVQAVNYLPMKADYLKADLITISGHKIYGPKGVGALYIKEGTPIKSIIFGGHQEYNIRPGTYNVAGIVGLGAAVDLVNNQSSSISAKGGSASGGNNQIGKLRDKLIDGLTKKIPDTQINGDMEKRVPGNANISFLGAEGESMLLMLDMEGIAVSTGSACASGSLEPSHVLRAMGMPPEDCHASIRFTLGKYTTAKEIDRVIAVLPKIVERLRKMSPLKRKR
ncbi:MAG: cysteine desulfurase family protein [Candidatus Parcubacteria bacterium]|nr:cysteine desulfurase family protein [Candidatus Parcubacteria bacterium]